MVRICCLLLLITGAWANTTMCRGIVVEANAKGDHRGRYIVLRVEYQTPRDKEDAVVKWHIPGNAVITLDGVKTDFTAFKSGRLVWLCNDAGYFKVFSRSYRFDDRASADDPANAWWTVHLPADVRQASSGWKSELILHLQVVAGAVKEAAAVTPGWMPPYGSSPAWHKVDATKLRVTGKQITGSCTVILEDRGVPFSENQLSAPRSFTIDLAVDGSGTVQMDKTTLLSEKGFRVLCRPTPVIPRDWYCFLRAPDPASRAWKRPDGRLHKTSNLHLEVRCSAGTVTCPSFRHGYGKPGSGPAATAIEMTLDDGQVAITATGKAGRSEVTFQMTGFVIGDRIFGTAEAIKGGQWKTRFTGYLRQVDSPSIGWDEGSAKKEASKLRGGK